MNPALATFILACCSAAISGQINCTDKSDGAYGSGCRSYTECKGGIGTLIDCLLNEEAFNYLTGKCQPIEDVPLPCGSSKNDCDKKDDGKYAVLPECTYFYTCFNHKFLGANPCNNPPDGNVLVFDESLQACNWKTSVSKPCGSKP